MTGDARDLRWSSGIFGVLLRAAYRANLVWNRLREDRNPLASVSDSAVVARFVAEVRAFHRASVDR